MSTSVLDRFIFRFATATPAIPATLKKKDGYKPSEIAGITRIAVANEKRDELPANESGEAPSDWWATLRAKIDQCDQLIHQLCDLRGDDAARRADLLAVRRRMAPEKLDGDIAYLHCEIQQCRGATASVKGNDS
jgi:hypothetical protein